MKTKITILLALAVIATACGSGTETKKESKETEKVLPIANENAAAFYSNLKSLCGKSFAGEEAYVQEGRESWADQPFTMHVTVCDEEQIHIPFHVGENTSRTWMFLNEGGNLRFRHDHRHPDGTPEDLTLYGGYATENGSPFRQEFPADDYTVDVHPRSEGAIWVVELTEDLSKFIYQLHHKGELLFEGRFDLTKEL